MSRLVRAYTLVLLSVMACNLALEAFSSHSQLSVSSNELSLSRLDLSESSPASGYDDDDCADHRCPAGGCHFGHCSFPLRNSEVAVASADSELDLHAPESLIPASFHVAGLRRPPRFS